MDSISDLSFSGYCKYFNSSIKYFLKPDERVLNRPCARTFSVRPHPKWLHFSGPYLGTFARIRLKVGSSWLQINVRWPTSRITFWIVSWRIFVGKSSKFNPQVTSSTRKVLSCNWCGNGKRSTRKILGYLRFVVTQTGGEKLQRWRSKTLRQLIHTKRHLTVACLDFQRPKVRPRILHVLNCYDAIDYVTRSSNDSLLPLFRCCPLRICDDLHVHCEHCERLSSPWRQCKTCLL